MMKFPFKLSGHLENNADVTLAYNQMISTEQNSVDPSSQCDVTHSLNIISLHQC